MYANIKRDFGFYRADSNENSSYDIFRGMSNKISKRFIENKMSRKLNIKDKGIRVQLSRNDIDLSGAVLKDHSHYEFYCFFVWSNTFLGVFKHFICLITHLFLSLICIKLSNKKTKKPSNTFLIYYIWSNIHPILFDNTSNWKNIV